MGLSNTAKGLLRPVRSILEEQGLGINAELESVSAGDALIGDQYETFNESSGLQSKLESLTVGQTLIVTTSATYGPLDLSTVANGVTLVGSFGCPGVNDTGHPIIDGGSSPAVDASNVEAVTIKGFRITTTEAGDAIKLGRSCGLVNCSLFETDATITLTDNFAFVESNYLRQSDITINGDHSVISDNRQAGTVTDNGGDNKVSNA